VRERDRGRERERERERERYRNTEEKREIRGSPGHFKQFQSSPMTFR